MNFRRDAFSFIGWAAIAAALVLNRWTVGVLIRPYGAMVGSAMDDYLIAAFQLTLLAFGWYLIRRRREPLRKELGTYGLLAVSLILCALMLEWYLRLVTPAPVFDPVFHLYPNYRECVAATFHDSTSMVSGSFTTNAWGFRGDPIPDNWSDYHTIVAIGGSTTLCRALPDEMTWPHLLEEYLRRDDPRAMVQNAGIDGHSTRGHVLMMEQIIPRIRPQMVLLLVGANDLAYALDHKSYEKEERGSLRYLFFSWSRTAQVVYRWYRILVEGVPRASRTVVPVEAVPLEHPPPPSRDSVETLLWQLPYFRANVVRIIALARQMGIEPVFMTQPSLLADTEYWRRMAGAKVWLPHTYYEISAAQFRNLLDRYNSALMEICREENVRCFDLASRVPSSWDYFYDSIHFTARGAALVARLVYHYLRTTPAIAPADSSGPQGRTR